ncbi:MAG: patatin-like phospholipase family protein [Bacteroidales bacterium]|nr:patatin-like phospholipase family protein [Bacteroidales bacterium]
MIIPYPQLIFAGSKTLRVYVILTVFLLFLLSESQAQNRIDSLLQQIEARDGYVKIGLVLAGGGAKGLAHIGVIKVLEEEGIKVDYIGGTSMGGLVGGLYALGNNASELEQITQQMDWDKMMSDKATRRDLVIEEKPELSTHILSLPLKGFVPNLPTSVLKGQIIQNEIVKLTWKAGHIHDFSKLPLPFFCIAADLETGKEIVLDSGNLAKALRATMSIPSVFEPIIYNNIMMVDGGIVNNFPVDIIKEKGVNFVIGIDVGSPLFKKEDIKSFIEVLQQSASFYGWIKINQNIELTDLYIHPNVDDISSLDFNNSQEIIQRGETAARNQIDDIRAVARYLNDRKTIFKQNKKLVFPDTIPISGLIYDSLTPAGIGIIKARLGLNLPGKYSINQINEAINRIFFSGYFEDVSYKIEIIGTTYFLKIHAEEKKNDLFKVGVHYNQYTKAAILLNINLINFIYGGTKTDLTFVLGENPAIKFSYFIDRGKVFGYGLKAGYTTRQLLFYDADFSDVKSSFFNAFSYFDLSLFTNYSALRRFNLGVRFENFNIHSNVSYIPNFIINTPYANIYAKYDLDFWDDANYPTSGFITTGTVTQTIKPGNEPLTTVAVKSEFALNLWNRRLIAQPGLFGVASFGNQKSYPYFYIIGGQNVTNYDRMIDFTGMAFTSFYEYNALIAKLKLRFQIKGRHHIFAIGNAGAFDNSFEKMIKKSKLYYGGGIGYSLNSLVGPIEFTISASNQGPKTHGVLNIGYWF